MAASAMDVDDDGDDYVPMNGNTSPPAAAVRTASVAPSSARKRKSAAAPTPTELLPSEREAAEQRLQQKTLRQAEADYRAAASHARRIATAGAAARAAPADIARARRAQRSAEATVVLPTTDADADAQELRLTSALALATGSSNNDSDDDDDDDDDDDNGDEDAFACIQTQGLRRAMWHDAYVSRLWRDLDSLVGRRYTARGGGALVERMQLCGLRFARIVTLRNDSFDVQLRIDTGMVHNDVLRIEAGLRPGTEDDDDGDGGNDVQALDDGEESNSDDDYGGVLVLRVGEQARARPADPSAVREYGLDPEFVRQQDMTPAERERANISELSSYLDDCLIVHTVWKMVNTTMRNDQQQLPYYTLPELLPLVPAKTRIEQRLHPAQFPDPRTAPRASLRLAGFYFAISNRSNRA
jgi:hypothetical protein